MSVDEHVKRDYIVFTDSLGRKIIGENYTFPGSMIDFTKVQVHYSESYGYSPSIRSFSENTRLIWDMKCNAISSICTGSDKCPCKQTSLLLMLTTKGHYVTANSAARTEASKAVLETLNAIKSRFGYLAVVFTKDMQMQDVQFALAKENFDLLILPYTAAELKSSQEARIVSNSLIHHCFTFSHIATNPEYPGCWHDSLEHFRWVNVFWRMHASKDFTRNSVEYTANLARIRQLEPEVEEFICMLVRLTREKRLQLTNEERDEIIFNVSRFARKFDQEELPFVTTDDEIVTAGDDRQGNESRTEEPRGALIDALE